ncbi:NYN domain-containing protein [Georhizobium profundi]|nr:NYN domain-containing protein [Georhizobium profundi]
MAQAMPQGIFLVDGGHYDRLKSTFATPLDLTLLRNKVLPDHPSARSIYFRDIRDASEEDRQRGLFGWLRHNRYEIKGRHFNQDADMPRERYGTNLVELAVEALSISQPGDTVALVASDHKLEPLLRRLLASGIECILVSTLNAPKTIAPSLSLVDAASRFVDIAEFEMNIAYGT